MLHVVLALDGRDKPGHDETELDRAILFQDGCERPFVMAIHVLPFAPRYSERSTARRLACCTGRAFIG